MAAEPQKPTANRSPGEEQAPAAGPGARPDQSQAPQGPPAARASGPTAGPAGPSADGRPRAVAEAAKVPREALRDFLYRFVAYVKSRKLYPAGHERLAKQLESWAAAVETILASQDRVSLFVQPDAIFVSGQKFAGDDRFTAEFAPELVKRLIRYISIDRGVTAEELAALAEPLLLEPEALTEAGGARALLANAAVAHILVIEFSYDMGAYVASEADVEVARTLAHFERGLLPEQYVLRRLAELQVNTEEKARLGQLLLEPEVARRLGSLTETLGQFALEGEADVHTSDLVLFVVRSLSQAEQDLGAVSPQNAARLVSHLLGRVQERLFAVLADPREREHRGVLSQVAKQMLSSPEALLHWLAPDVDRLSLTLSADLAELLKAIFSRAESGRRRMPFGETALGTLEAPDEAGGKPPLHIEHSPEAAVDIPALARQLDDLHGGLAGRRFALGLESVGRAHIDILLELISREPSPAGRERLLRELGRTVGAQLTGGDGREILRLAERVLSEDGLLSDEELDVFLLTPDVLRQALREYLAGETRWEVALHRMTERRQASFADALGRVVLEAEEAYPLANLERFISPCQEELLTWLRERLRAGGPSVVAGTRIPAPTEAPAPVERVVSLVLGCRTVRAVPLVEQLLHQAGPEARRALLRHLVRIGDARAVSALTDQLATGDASTRQDILYLLGESSQPLAEETLLQVAVHFHWGKRQLAERLTALSSLARSAGERSLGPLRALARSWTLKVVPGGRQVRERAAAALRAAEARQEKGEGEPPVGSEPPGARQGAGATSSVESGRRQTPADEGR